MTLPFSGRALAAAALLALAGCASAPPPAPIEIHLAALNDLHGYLEPSSYTYTSVRDRVPHTVEAGGAAVLSRTLAAWRRQDPELLLIGSGDLIGGSPPLSAMWADEPTLAALDALGLRVSALGNHELDWGKAELLRQQHGGCASPRPDKACQFDGPWRGARFTYLAANVIDTDTGKPLLPAYRIEQAHGVKVAFIGAVLREAPGVVKASGVAGLRFEDEAESVNRLLPALKAQGATVFVVLIHQGGATAAYFDDPSCKDLQGPIVDAVKRLDPAIRLVLSGHTHQGYLCQVGDVTVTQAQNQGRLLSRLALRVDPATRALTGVRAENVVMAAGGAAEPAVAALLANVKARSAAVLGRPVARLAAPLVSREQNAAGESALGDLVADAELAAARGQGARIAFLNYSTMRSDLQTGPGLVASAGQTAVVLPFGNALVLMTLTGAQIRALLEQQRWPGMQPGDAKMLEVSAGLSYRWDARRPAGGRVVPGSLTLDGLPMPDAGRYRVVVNSFLAQGGDGYTVLREGAERADLPLVDLDAFNAYLAERDRAGQPAGRTQPDARILRAE